MNEKRGAVALFAFFLFFFLKINGFFDFTHRYGIREISATMDQEKVMTMLDEDMNTSWNSADFLGDPMVKPGDSIRVDFDKKKTILGVRMKGIVPQELIIYDGENNPISSDASDGEFIFHKPVDTDSIVLTVGGEGEQKWNVAELEIVE